MASSFRYGLESRLIPIFFSLEGGGVFLIDSSANAITPGLTTRTKSNVLLNLIGT